MDARNITDFSMEQVLVENAYCKNALKKEVDYLLAFDTDRLLSGFRETAGMEQKGKKRYGGWENTLIGGHAIGHYMTACAQACVNPGVDLCARSRLRQMLMTLVDGMGECQACTKGKEGFLFSATLVDQDNVEVQFDNVEQGLTNIMTQAWVPWYTMHKLIAGLLDVYRFLQYEPARAVVEKLGDWVCTRVATWDEQTRQTVLGIEYGGMNDCLYDLYVLTGKEKYAAAAHAFDEDALFCRVKEGGKDVLNQLHANTTIPKFIGALKRYVCLHGKALGEETVDAAEYLDYAVCFWEMVIRCHTYVTGGNSEWEHFGEDFRLDAERTNCNNETCNTYNMLKLSRMLFEITGEKKYLDYYENAFVNSILSSQNPKTGMTTYFQPMATGYFKVYGSRFDHFWCCTGSGMENFTKLNDSIYFRKENTLYVSLYLSSWLNWEDKGLVISQSGDLLKEETITFEVEKAKGEECITIALRMPQWSVGKPTLKLNGKQLVIIQSKGNEAEEQTEGAYLGADGFLRIERRWEKGDRLCLELPMELRAHGLADDDTVIAFSYGPFVLSAGLGTEEMQTKNTGVMVSIPAAKKGKSEVIGLPANVSRRNFTAQLSKYFIRQSQELSFLLEGTKLYFSPHFLRHDERYGIYWYLLTEEEQEARKGILDRRTQAVDTVQPGYGQYENDLLHNMQEKDSIGVTNDGTYRYAKAGGCFSYNMAVHPAKQNLLVLYLRKEDNGKPLRIFCERECLYDDRLLYEGAQELYELVLPIPQELSENAREVNVIGETHHVLTCSFEAGETEDSARVCEFLYMVTE